MQAARAGHIHKGAFGGVAKQPVLPHTGDQNIREAVVVVISDGYAHAVHFDIKTGLARHIGKAAVAIVLVKTQRRMLPFVSGPIHSVDQQDILPPVCVVIQERAA